MQQSVVKFFSKVLGALQGNCSAPPLLIRLAVEDGCSVTALARAIEAGVPTMYMENERSVAAIAAQNDIAGKEYKDKFRTLSYGSAPPLSI